MGTSNNFMDTDVEASSFPPEHSPTPVVARALAAALSPIALSGLDAAVLSLSPTAQAALGQKWGREAVSGGAPLLGPLTLWLRATAIPHARVIAAAALDEALGASALMLLPGPMAAKLATRLERASTGGDDAPESRALENVARAARRAAAEAAAAFQLPE